MLHPYNYANILRSLFVLSSVKVVPPPLSTHTSSLAYIHSQAYTQPSSLSMTTPTPQWLQERLTTLLSSPHISMPSHIGGIRLGHGPIDLFSTRYTNMFTSDAVGIVAGQEVDKEGLKQALLALQKKWDPESTNFVAADAGSQQVSAPITINRVFILMRTAIDCYSLRMDGQGRGQASKCHCSSIVSAWLSTIFGTYLCSVSSLDHNVSALCHWMEMKASSRNRRFRKQRTSNVLLKTCTRFCSNSYMDNANPHPTDLALRSIINI